MGLVQVEVGLEFNSTASPDEIPTADAVVDALIRAVNVSNSTFDLPVDPNSIDVIRK